MTARTLRGKVAVVGIGETTYYKHGQSPDAEFKLALQAILAACADAGIHPHRIDGFASYSDDRSDATRLAVALGLPRLRSATMQWGGGGGGCCAAVANGALSYSVVTLKYSHALTNLFGFADSKGSGYLDLSANFDLGDGWSVVPHVGRQWIRHNSAYAYTDYAVTVNKDFGNGLVASAGVVGTNADKALYVTPSGRFTGRTAVFAAIKYSF